MHQSEFVSEESRGCRAASIIDSPLPRGVYGCEESKEIEDGLCGDAVLHCGYKR